MSTQDKPPGMPEEKPVDRAADKMRRKIQEATDELRALAAKDAEIAKLREQRDMWIAGYHHERKARIGKAHADYDLAVEGFRIVDRKVEESGNG